MSGALSDLQALGQVLDCVGVGFCAFDQAHRTLLWNRVFLEIFPEYAANLHAGEPAGEGLRRLVPERAAPSAVQSQQILLEDGRAIDVASIDVPGLGRASVWRARKEADRAQALPRTGEAAGALSHAERESGYRLLARLTGDVVASVAGGRLEYVSPSVESLLGWKPEALEGRAAGELLVPAHASMLDAAFSLGVTQPLQVRARRADGGDCWVEIRLTPTPGLAGTGLLNVRDISARKAMERQLEQTGRELEALALTDALTGTANRRSFDQGLEAEWRRSHRERKPLALLLFDVDFFKRINDTHGHPAGDEVLRRLAAQLRARARRPGDLAARFGGEEFALVLPGTEAEPALQIADQVRHAFAASFADRPELAGTVSVGVAVAPDDAGSPAELLQHADAALYRAKAQGRDRCVRWSP